MTNPSLAPPPYRPRLSILFASAAPKAVILRRGPKKHWHLITWDLETDTFTHGQWIKGLVRLWDLSPGGDKLIYWAAQYHASAGRERPVRSLGPYDPVRAVPTVKAKGHRKVPRYLRSPIGLRRSPHPVRGTWTAISTPPYFTALALWPAFGHWTGGGLFRSDRDILIMEPENRMVPIEHVAIPQGVKTRSFAATGAARLDIARRSASSPSLGENLTQGPVWKGLASAGATWVEWAHEHPSTGHLLFACDGSIYRLSDWRDLPTERYLAAARKLADFNDLRFTMLPAPHEALRW